MTHFKAVCDEHRDVGIDGVSTGSEIDRLRVELAQVTAALAKEMGKRRIVEAAYARARAARDDPRAAWRS